MRAICSPAFAVEGLDRRLLLSVVLGGDGVVTVTGTDLANDVVTIGPAATAGRISVSLNGAASEFDAADVAGFNVDLGEGNNNVMATVDLPVTVTTGGGNDTIATAGGDDDITTGSGEKDISLGDGDDALSAADSGVITGVQTIKGGDGRKRILVRRSTTTIDLGVGNSVIDCAFNLHTHVTIAGGDNTVTTGAGSVTIGGSGNNIVRVAGGDPNLAITTGDGDDAVYLQGPGTVRTNGGDDFVQVFRTIAPATIFLGDGNDRAVDISRLTFGQDVFPAYTVFGGLGNDSIEGAGGGDKAFFGEAGDDTLNSGPGNDLLNGGTGNDQLNAGAGKDRLYGWTGDDTLDAGSGDDRVFGQTGNDALYGDGGDDQLHGGVGHDRLYAQRGNDALFGEGGNDRLYADYSSGVATLHGGNGDDQLVTADGLVDNVFGDAGVDSAVADGSDVLNGVESIDTGGIPPAPAELPGLTVGGGLLQVIGSNDAEHVTFRADGKGGLVVSLDGEERTFDIGRVARIDVTGNGGDDVIGLLGGLPISAWLRGDDGDDRLIGGDGDDTLDGGNNHDYMDGGRGSDRMDGGFGFDTVDYSARTANLTITVGTSPNDIYFEGDGEAWERDDVRSPVERIMGGSGNDHVTEGLVLIGNDGNDTLNGWGGSDFLYGGRGDDHLDGSFNEDHLEGGEGHDVLIGGDGFDTLFGQGGNDRLFSAGDDDADTVRGDAGTDSAEADAIDDVAGVESVQRSAAER